MTSTTTNHCAPHAPSYSVQLYVTCNSCVGTGRARCCTHPACDLQSTCWSCGGAGRVPVPYFPYIPNPTFIPWAPTPFPNITWTADAPTKWIPPGDVKVTFGTTSPTE